MNMEESATIAAADAAAVESTARLLMPLSPFADCKRHNAWLRPSPFSR